MDLLNKYFEELTFSYIEEKKGYAIYGAAIHSQMAGDKQRYVLVFVPAHLGIQTSAKLSELPWRNLQTRLCSKITYRLKPQAWTFPYKLLNLTFRVSNRNKTYTTYQQEMADDVPVFPFDVLLIHNPKKKSVYQYPNGMNLHWAIDQFSTVFNYVGEVQPIRLTTLPPLPLIPTPPPAGNPLASWFNKTQSQAGDGDFELIN